MQLSYLTVYLEVLVLCFVFCAVILFNINRDLGGEREAKTFKYIIITMLIALVIDGLTHSHYRGAIQIPKLILGLLYASYMFLFSGVLSYLWVVFVQQYLGVRNPTYRNILYFAFIPVIIIGVCAFASIKTGWFFVIDQYNIYHRGPFWTHQSIVSYVYFFLTAIESLVFASKEKSRQKKRQFYVLSTFIIAPVIGALLQIFVGSHPFIAPATCVAIFFIFVNVQKSMINHDSLTGLNNRDNFAQYLDEFISHANEEPFYLYGLRINNFKKINDEFGHSEGDRIIKAVADSLNEVSESYHGYVARYGGGEFYAAVDSKYIDKPSDFYFKFLDTVNKHCEGFDFKCNLDYSDGYMLCNDPNTNSDDLITEVNKHIIRRENQ